MKPHSFATLATDDTIVRAILRAWTGHDDENLTGKRYEDALAAYRDAMGGGDADQI